MAAVLSLPHLCEALVGLETRRYHAAAHSVKSGRCSTDSGIQARLGASVDASTPNQLLIHLKGSFTSSDVKGEIYLLLDFLLFNRHDNKGFVTLSVYNDNSDKTFGIHLR